MYTKCMCVCVHDDHTFGKAYTPHDRVSAVSFGFTTFIVFLNTHCVLFIGQYVYMLPLYNQFFTVNQVKVINN